MTLKNLAHRQKVFYNKWENYSRLYTNINLDWYRKTLELFCSLLDCEGRVLDLGCGIGITTKFLTEKYKTTIGVDYSLEFCKIAQAKRPTGGILINGDAAALPIKDGSIDGIFSFGALEHMCDVAASLGEMDRVVRSGGIILIHMPDLLTPLRPLKAIFSRQKLRYPKPESGKNIFHSTYLIVRDVMLAIKKYWAKSPIFMYREPDFEIIEGDYDAVYLASPMDIKKYFRKDNYEVHDVTHVYKPYEGPSCIKKMLKWVFFKTRVFQVIKMPAGTYTTLLMRKK